MSSQISLEQVAEENGFDSVDLLLEWAVFESVVPSTCMWGCEVEPDGVCSHGNPSCLLAAHIS